MIDRIKEVYEELSNEINQGNLYNNKETRSFIKNKLNEKLGTDLFIKCDEENNPPDIVISNTLLARVYFSDNFKDYYVDLEF